MMNNASKTSTQVLDSTSANLTSDRRRRKVRTFHLPISERRIVLMAGDLVAIEVAAFFALVVWSRQAHHHLEDVLLTQSYWFFILPLMWLLLATASDYYNLRVTAKVRVSLWRLAMVESQALFIYVAIFFLSTPRTLPRRFIIYYVVLSFLLIGWWRATRIFLVGWTGFRCRAFIVGAGREADVIWQALKEEAPGDYEVVGFVTSERELMANPDQSLYLGSGAELPRLVTEYGVTELIMAYASDMPEDVFKGLLACHEAGVQVTPMARLYQQVTGRIPVEHVSEQLWTMILPEEARSLRVTLYAIWKRMTDIALALIGLALFAPVLPLLALVIKIDSRGPVFYTQTRLGKGGKPFQIIKLRSMIVNAEQESGPQWAKANDSRVTRVGAFLRRTRLDEVPQLLSVVAGDMSLIGPRPERPEFVEQLSLDIPFYRARLAVKPGLSGWAQVRYRYGNSRDDALRKLEYDLYYIRHQSPVMDFVIGLRTIGVILLFRGM
jgi:exopolysaccharide biosynthesis polyprenyl glycosylphosphotransferase